MKTENLPSIVKARCTPVFKDALNRLAKKKGQTVSEFVRTTLLTAVEDEFGDNWAAVVTWHPESPFLLESR